MIKDFKDLEKLFKLCRKQGIQDMDFNGIKFRLGDLPADENKNQTNYEQTASQLEGFPDGILTQEQLMFYSSGGLPSEDPELKGATQ